MLLTIICIVLLFMSIGGLFSYALVHPGSQFLGKTVVHGDEQSDRIAITFDDGPGESTSQILDTLKQAGVRATFFLCGKSVERFPELARRIAAEGHEIANHTYSHPYLFWKTPGRIALEIDRAQEIISHATGCKPTLFRPPYGVQWFGLFPVLASRGMTAVLWSVSSRDWRYPAARIAQRVIGKAKPGAIVLMHDGVPPSEPGNRAATAEALPEIIRNLGERFRFATVSEIQSEPRP